MAAIDTNIYRTCRVRTRLSQEAWAEKLGVSVESVKRYELDKSVPSNRTVVAMINESGYEALAIQHMILTSQSLDVLPGVETDVPLSEAVIQLINLVYAFADDHRDRQLLRIAEDGIISEDERPLYNTILEKLQEIISAAYRVRYANDRREVR